MFDVSVCWHWFVVTVHLMLLTAAVWTRLDCDSQWGGHQMKPLCFVTFVLYKIMKRRQMWTSNTVLLIVGLWGVLCLSWQWRDDRKQERAMWHEMTQRAPVILATLWSSCTIRLVATSNLWSQWPSVLLNLDGVRRLWEKNLCFFVMLEVISWLGCWLVDELQQTGLTSW